MKKLFVLTAALAIFFLACQKNNPPNPTPSPAPNPPARDTTPNPTSPQNPPPTIISPGVYIAGDSFDLSSRLLPYPIYWKNGTQVHLPHAGYSSGTGIAVSDSAVYVSSSGIYLGNNVTYWKNGTGINLADPTVINSTAMGIALSGNDVYTVGGAYINNYEKFVPVYWKNQDKAIKISTFSGSRGDATSIAVAGGDVYVTGSTYDDASKYSPACYWKNGLPVFLHSGTTIYENGMARSLALSGADVHVAGDVQSTQFAPAIAIATYWKNGNATALTNATTASTATSLFVTGSDVYIAGGIAGPDRLLRAAYWKNGVATILDSNYSLANSIAVLDNDVYVAGNRGVDSALYWKNGRAVMLGRGRANAIVVRK